MGWFSSLVGGVVGFFIGGPVGAVIGAGLGATKVGEKVVNTVLDFVLQPFLGNIPNIDAGSEADRQQGVLIQRQGSDENIPVMYGYRKLGGTVAFAETGSSNNKYLYVAYVFCEGPVEGLREVFIDDWQLPTALVGDLNANRLVTVNADRYKDRVQLQFSQGVYLNDLSQNVVGNIVKNGIFKDAPSFRNDMNFNGLCVMFARYEWKEIKTQEDADNNPFTGNIPELKIGLLGKRVASLLVDAENSTYDSAVVRYSTNPAECLLDYLRNPRYGKGLLNSDIDWDSWKKAARKCNQTVTYVASGITGPILTLNYVADTGQSLMSNTKNMLQNFRGYMPYVQGKYKLKIEDAGNETDILSGSALIVATITKDDIIGEITFNGIDKGSKYNVVSVTYVDPDQKFSNQSVVYPESEEERQRYIRIDGGRENKHEVTYSGITNYAIAKDMARLIFNKSRRQDSCALTITSRGLELEPGDNIRIDSNVLDFGTVPWRIVTVKINENMTVSLGCVRNPDDIYPYVRVGEEDVVLPTYVPKGSVIYFPGSLNTPPLGLVPPTGAVSNIGGGGTSTVLPPTDPNAPGGGGVGGEDNSGGNSGGNDTNNPGTDPPPPPPFNATLTFKSVKLTKVDNNTSIYNLTFTQPQDALYQYSIFWWRYNTRSAWIEMRIDTLPGPGRDIPVNIGPIPTIGNYEYYIRSFASDGRASGFVTRGGFRSSELQSGAPGNFIAIGEAGAIQVTEGWTVPAAEIPVNPWYDDTIELFNLEPVLTAGAPQNPRRVKATFAQFTYGQSAKINPLIDGIRIYYKYKDDTYYNFEDYKFGADYFPGKQITWTLSGEFGAPVYPQLAIYSATAFQNYDFIVRLTYSDGTTAKKQIGPGRGPVEQDGLGNYNFKIFGTDPYAMSGGGSRDIPQGFTILDYTQNPNRSYASGSELIPNIAQAIASTTISRIQWTFNPPANSKFRGYKIRIREVVPGADPDFVEFIVGTTVDTDYSFIRYNMEGNGYRHSTKYEWVVTALYSNNGVITDATKSLYCRALIPFDVPSGTNLVNSFFTFEEKDTKTMIEELTAAFPSAGAIVPHKWILKQIQPVSSANADANFIQTGGAIEDLYRRDSNNVFLNRYYTLVFQTPNNIFDNLVVYRRVYSATGLGRTTAGSSAAYYPLGPWERKAIPRAALSYNSTTQLYTVNVRGPIAPEYFNAYHEVRAGTPLVNVAFGPSGQFPYDYTSFAKFSGIYPYFGCNAPVTSGYEVEFLFVLDLGGEDTKACRLKSFSTNNGLNTSVPFLSEVDGIQTKGIKRDDYVTTTEFNNLNASYNRNLNQALSGIIVSDLTNDTIGYAPKIPKRDSTNNNLIRLQPPTNGATVY